MAGLNTKSNKFNFIVLPLVVFFFYPDLQDPTGIPKLIGLIFGTLALIILNQRYLRLVRPMQFLPWLIVFSYILIQGLKNNNFEEFILGTYTRNGGIIALISFAIIFTIISNFQINLVSQFLKIFKLTYLGLLFYGILQEFDLLPFKQTNNYQDSISLTLSNPNFASAYLGIALSVLPFLISKVNYIRYLDVISIFFGCYLLFRTDSIQGVMIILVNCIIYIMYFKDKLLNTGKKWKVVFTVFTFPILIIIIFNLANIANWLYINGSIRQRFNYWELVVRIFKDNWIFGIGLDNLSNKVNTYRDIEFLRQEGTFTIIDRSHNVFLDHFVNGGILVGSLWLVFIFLVSKKSIRLMCINQSDLPKSSKFAIIGIWFGYVSQSLISADHLSLTLLAFITSGFILSMQNPKNVDGSSFMKSSDKVKITFFSVLFSMFLLYGIYIARIEQWVYQVVQNSNYTSIDRIYNAKTMAPRSLENVAVKISNDKQYELANKFGDKLLQFNQNSHQAFFMKSVYYESKGELAQAKELMLSALSNDKLNSVYLLSMALYENKLGNKDEASEYLRKTIEVDPTQQGIDYVKNEILKNKFLKE